MLDRMGVIKTKLDRADEHIHDLTAWWAEFGKRTYDFHRPDEPGADGRWHTRLIAHEPLPPRVGAVIGDAATNMRAALDYLIYQLVDAKGLTVTYRHYFPISASEAEFSASFRSKVKGVGAEAERLIEGIRPYKGGDDRFWHLNELRRVNEHRLLLTAVVRPSATALNVADMLSEIPAIPGMEERADAISELADQFIIIRAAPKPCPPLSDGDIVYSESRPSKRTQLTLVLGFGEGEVLECEEVLETLHGLLQMVRESVELFRPLLT